jgi:hypothetical protein
MEKLESQLSRKLINFILFLYIITIKFIFTKCSNIEDVLSQNNNYQNSIRYLQLNSAPNPPSLFTPQFIFKIDMGITSNNTYSQFNNPWGVSNHTNNYPNAVNFTLNPTRQDQPSILNLDPVSTSDKIQLELGDETLGVQINSLNILKDKEKYLNFGSDISLTTDISPRISPRDYFNKKLIYSNLNLNNTSASPFVNCKYTNNGPFYKRAILKNVDIDYLVNTYNKNLGIKNEELGIKLITMENFTLTYQALDDYINQNSKGEEFSKTNSMNFTKLFLTQDFMSYDMTKYILAALTDQQDLYIYNITDNSYTNFNIRQWDVITKISLLNMTDINKVSIYNGNVIISSRTGLSILKKNSSNEWSNTNFRHYPVNNKTYYPLILKDSLLVNSTLFMIIENFGLVSFDMTTMSFSSNYFSHSRLVQLDYTAFRNLFYIGVLVDNLPPSIPEFFIEFAFNYDNPSLPLINKIFISDRDINIKDIASDDTLGLTYIMEPGSSNLYLLTRGIANTIPTYNFVIDFKGYYNFDITQKLELMFISENDAFFPSLVINNGKDYILFGRFNYPRNTLTCQMSVDGEYTYTFNAPMDCSYFNNEKFNYNTCWNNATVIVKADSSIKSGSGGNNYNYNEHHDENNDDSFSSSEMPEDHGDHSEEDNIGLWIVLGIAIIAVILIVVLVVCCRHRICRKDSKGTKVPGVSYMKQSVNGEEVEVQVMDNKL